MKVIDYQLYWDMTSNVGGIHLRLEDHSVVTLAADDPGKLVVWVDLLRNDTPVVYWKSGDREGLASNWEHVRQAEDEPPSRYQQDGQE